MVSVLAWSSSISCRLYTTLIYTFTQPPRTIYNEFKTQTWSNPLVYGGALYTMQCESVSSQQYFTSQYIMLHFHFLSCFGLVFRDKHMKIYMFIIWNPYSPEFFVHYKSGFYLIFPWYCLPSWCLFFLHFFCVSMSECIH